MISQHGTGEDSFFTDSRYWDCGCKKNYIHHKRKFGRSCPKCLCISADYPDSRVHEIHEQIGIEYPKKYLRKFNESAGKYEYVK